MCCTNGQGGKKIERPAAAAAAACDVSRDLAPDRRVQHARAAAINPIRETRARAARADFRASLE